MNKKFKESIVKSTKYFFHADRVTSATRNITGKVIFYYVIWWMYILLKAEYLVGSIPIFGQMK